MERIDFIGLQVANLSQVVDFYTQKFKFHKAAKAINEGVASVLMHHGNVTLRLTGRPQYEKITPLSHPLTQEVTEIGFEVKDVDAVFNNAIKHGASEILPPTTHELPKGKIRIATVSAFGNVVHSFIQRESEEARCLPGFDSDKTTNTAEHTLNTIDHIAVCVNQGDLDRYVEFYQNAYGMIQSYEEYVTTENSGMNSKVMESPNGLTKIVFVEPVAGKKQSQIADYLHQYNGPCVQHIAFSTSDMVNVVKKLRNNGVDFLSIPDSYYVNQRAKLNVDNDNFETLRELSILIDRHESGYLYQIFTKGFTPQPTLFFEIIQRTECTGFGSGNIKALFKAIEEEQLVREKVNCR